MFYASYGKEVATIRNMMSNLPAGMLQMYESDVRFVDTLSRLPATLRPLDYPASTDVSRSLLRVEPRMGKIELNDVCSLVTAFYVPPEVDSLTLTMGRDEFSWFADSETRTIQELLTSERTHIATVLQESRLPPCSSVEVSYVGNPKCLSVEGKDYTRLEMVYPFLFLASITFNWVDVQMYPNTELLVEGADGHIIDRMVEPNLTRLSFVHDHKRKEQQPLINSGGLIIRRYEFSTPPELQLLKSIDGMLPAPIKDIYQ